MPVGIGASGLAGLALETTPGTYIAPTKFFGFDSESIQWTQDQTDRRPIRQSADLIGQVLGNGRVEGDMEMDFLEDIVPYFLYAARTTVTKGGTNPNYTYAFKGSAAAVAGKTMSLTIVRNGAVFGYVGMCVASFTINVDSGLLKFSASMLGMNEASQASPTATFVNTLPFGDGSYTIGVGGSTITDSDAFSFTVDDNGSAQNRLVATRGAAFISYGERSVTVSMDRDFQNRTEYDSFKTLTTQAVTFVASKGANNSVNISVPVGYRNAYEINLGGQGDLLRVSQEWAGAIDGAGNAYTVTIACQENIT